MRGHRLRGQPSAARRRPSLFLALAEKPCHDLLGLNVESLANPQQCEQGRRASSLDHLPVADAEPVGNHVLLAQFALRAIRADAMAQGAEETLVACRKFPGSAHHSKL